MSVFKDPIDYDGLEKELQEAIRADELYSLQNDAKFRAIEQGVPTYDDFREMVNAAHLKSLDRKDMTPKVGVKWNSIANDKKNSQSQNPQLKLSFNQRKTKKISSDTTPRNTHEFRQAWKKLVNNKDKFQFLNNTRLSMRNQIFRSEIPPDVLSESLRACLECVENIENANSVVDILITFSECYRFKLAVAFMSEQEKSVCRQLFQSLYKGIDKKSKQFNIVKNLEEKYVS